MKRLSLSVVFVLSCSWLGLTEAHFSLAPKIAIEPLTVPQPDTTLFKFGEVTASRGQFTDYLERLTVFETKYQRVQPNFSAHFNLVQGVAFFHPENVNNYIDGIEAVRDNPELYNFSVAQWIKGQVGVYAQMIRLSDHALRGAQEHTPEVKAVLDFCAAGVKTALLEELVVLGEMKPSVDAVKRAIQRGDKEVMRLIREGPLPDTALTSPDEQRRLKKRWREFRKDLLESTARTNYCESIKTFSEPPDTIVVEVGERKINLGEYLAIFGIPANEKQWTGQKRGSCSRMILFYAMADLVDSLGIMPPRLKPPLSG